MACSIAPRSALIRAFWASFNRRALSDPFSSGSGQNSNNESGVSGNLETSERYQFRISTTAHHSASNPTGLPVGNPGNLQRQRHTGTQTVFQDDFEPDRRIGHQKSR